MSNREKQLVQAVFATENGQELLQIWYDQHIVSPIFHQDTNVMYSRIGMQEFVQRILTDTDGE